MGWLIALKRAAVNILMSSDEWSCLGVITGLGPVSLLVIWTVVLSAPSLISKFSDDELCGMVDTLQDMDTIQRDLDRFERWGCAKKWDLGVLVDDKLDMT